MRPLQVVTMIACVMLALLSVVIPIAKILRRTGHSAIWSVLMLFPFINAILLWVFAFKPWPIDSKPNV